MLQRDHRPVGQPDHLLGDSLDPDLEQRQLAADATNTNLIHITTAHVGLVEHVRIRVQSEQIPDVYATRIIKQVAKRRRTSTGINPLLQSASLRVAVIVDRRRPARDDGQPSVPVGRHVGDGRPEGVLGVTQDGARVIADDVADAVIHERLDGVAVEQARDGGRDQTRRGEHGGGTKTDLVQPGLVEVDLLVGVAVGRVVKLLVRKGVRHRGKGVEVRAEPLGDVIQQSTLERPGIVHVARVPQSNASSQRLLEV